MNFDGYKFSEEILAYRLLLHSAEIDMLFYILIDGRNYILIVPTNYACSAADNLYSILRFNESGTDRVNYVFPIGVEFRECLSS